MAQIKDTNIIKTPEVVINPAFFLPPDVIDMRPGTDDDLDSYDSVSDFDEDDDDAVSGDEPDVGGSLRAPDSLTIVEQIVRIGPDGNAVVDVIIEFDDDGHSEYDIRVTKDS